MSEVNFSVIDSLLEEMLPEMETDLAALIADPSVEAPPAADNAPFGQAVRASLDCMLDISKKMGFETGDLDGYCGYADLPAGEGEIPGMAGVLGHMDIVPAVPEEWIYPPFELTRDGDRLYGRGTMDDKGPTLAALYGAYALKRAGVKLSRRVRFVYGCNEETGMKCMKHYAEHAELPVMGFTPDAEWPLIIGEKGGLGYKLKSSWKAEDIAGTGMVLEELVCGVASNVVPAAAYAVFKNENDICSALPEAEGITASYDETEKRIIITSSGAAAHASTPEVGDNALTKLLRYLKGLSFAPAGAAAYIRTVARLTEDDCFGAALGVDLRDELSFTTNAPTMCHIDQVSGELNFDMRFCLSHEPKKYEDILSEKAASNGLVLEVTHGVNPLYLGADAPLTPILLESYREVTGDMTEPLIIGGGTYAKKIPGFMAFGPESHTEPTRAHQANEYITEKELLDAAKIYARAIWRMAK